MKLVLKAHDTATVILLTSRAWKPRITCAIVDTEFMCLEIRIQVDVS